MGLQLKGENEPGSKGEGIQKNGEESINPWELPNVVEEKEPYHTVVINNATTAEIQGAQKQGNPVIKALIKLLMFLLAGAVLFFVGKANVGTIMTEGTDITSLLRKDANAIAADLGITFTDNAEWISQIHQYSKGAVTVKAAEDIGIVYIDGQQAGIHIRSKKYTIYGIQVGDGEKETYDYTSYPYDNFLSVINDMAAGKTTTYFYYNVEHNDCVAITINDTTNRIVGMTYFYDYKKITETLE